MSRSPAGLFLDATGADQIGFDGLAWFRHDRFGTTRPDQPPLTSIPDIPRQEK